MGLRMWPSGSMGVGAWPKSILESMEIVITHPVCKNSQESKRVPIFAYDCFPVPS